ncbi:hypothetical protein DMN91_001511 [Ooceraea biroi]|uniref:RNase H type-1 domain-containing protein n=1 Tax=Ooceraea biroi TaxID=2015173 RepID=A0A3L8DZ11_OOCBI|nr:hypothetical protein DMN91_001511 [Ooceraea biroi]
MLDHSRYALKHLGSLIPIIAILSKQLTQIVIKEIPTSVSEEDLLLEFKNGNPNLPVKEIYRLKRRVVHPVSGAASFVDSESVKVTIRSSTIPQFVFLWKIRVSTSIFIPRLLVCHNCGQLNHPTKFCRNAAKCLNCGEAKHPESVTCVKPAVCISCSCNHRTFSKDCKEYFKRREINRVMAVDNVDFRTARLTLEDSLKNVLNDAGCRQNMNPKEFPPLRVSRYFTDGSKYAAESFAGYGIVALTNNECKTYRRRSSNYTSIFTLEGMAIASALKLALCDPNPTVLLFSDSASVLESLTSKRKWCKMPHIVLEILELTFKLKQAGKVVKFFWTLAHVRIRYNELADQLAKDAIRSGIDSEYCLPASDFKSVWKERLFSSFMKWCKLIGTSKDFVPTIRHWPRVFLKYKWSTLQYVTAGIIPRPLIAFSGSAETWKG